MNIWHWIWLISVGVSIGIQTHWYLKYGKPVGRNWFGQYLKDKEV